MQDALAALAANLEPVKLGPVIEALSELSRYTILQPKIICIGINFNNIIDDVVELAEKKARGEIS